MLCPVILPSLLLLTERGGGIDAEGEITKWTGHLLKIIEFFIYLVRVVLLIFNSLLASVREEYTLELFVFKLITSTLINLSLFRIPPSLLHLRRRRSNPFRGVAPYSKMEGTWGQAKFSLTLIKAFSECL